MLEKIKFKEFKRLYRTRMVQDFSSNERPKLQGFRKRMLKYNEEVFIYSEDNKEKAYLIVDELEENYILISFLAVYKEYRGQGIGSKLLKEIREKYQNKKAILLEVENPEYAKEKERTVMEKRISFYKKSDYEIVSNLEMEMFFVQYKIMALKNGDFVMDKETIARVIQNYYNKILKKPYRKFIKSKIKIDLLKGDFKQEKNAHCKCVFFYKT